MRSEAILKRFDELGICRPGGLRRPGAGSLQGLLPGAPTEPDLRLIKPPLSQCLIPDPGRMDIGDQDLKTDNLLHDDVCSADLLERESAMSFHSRRRSRPSAQTTHRPRGGTCRERTQPRIAQMRSLSTGIGSAGQVRQPPLVAIELPGPDPPMGQLATRQELPHRRARVALPGSWGVIPFPVELRRDLLDRPALLTQFDDPVDQLIVMAQ